MERETIRMMLFFGFIIVLMIFIMLGGVLLETIQNMTPDQILAWRGVRQVVVVNGEEIGQWQENFARRPHNSNVRTRRRPEHQTALAPRQLRGANPGLIEID